MSIFSDNAPAYWAAGLPVFPLQGKAVKINAWSSYCSMMPTEETKTAWLTGSLGTNIGLPLGPESRMVGIDVDTDDPQVHDMLAQLLPVSPWKRVGKKGSVTAYRYNGERTFRIKDVKGNTILECLSLGAQIVVPPSIHPETMRPYTENRPLVEAIAMGLPGLPPQIEIVLRTALIDLGYELSTQGFTKITAWVPAGSRDSAMTAFAGLQSRAVVRGELTLADAQDQMQSWVSNYVAKVAGDDIDIQKARDKVVGFFVRDATGPGRKAVAPGWDIDLDPKMRTEIKALLGEDGEAWTFEQFQHFATTEFEAHNVGTGGYAKAIATIVHKMAHCSAMTIVEEHMFVAFIVNCSQKTLTMATVRRQVADMKAGEMDGVDHTQIAQALIPEVERYGEIRFYNAGWWRFTGACWERMEDGVILHKIAELFGSYPAAKRFGDHKGIMAIAGHMLGDEICTKPVEGINFANGFLTSDMNLVPHSHEYGKTYVLPYRYMPELAGHFPLFQQFLFDCWGHEEDFEDKVQALREAIATTMFGLATQFQRAICMFGVSGSGKSTLINIVKDLIPSEGQCSVRPSQWDDKFSPAQMEGKLFNFAGELSDNRMIQGDVFKLIVEGAPIEVQHKFGQVFVISPRCAHWFGSNHIPKTRDTSAGFTRRWLIFAFNKRVASGMSNVNLAQDIIAEEREAIAAWAAEALPALLRRGCYTLPQSHKDAVMDMAQANNSVRFFIQSSGQVRIATGETGLRTSEPALYDRYYAFCTAVANVSAVTLRQFRGLMLEMCGELGFRADLTRTEWGSVEASYESITIVQSAARSK